MQEHIQATKPDDGMCIENTMGHSLVAGKVVPHGSAFKSVVWAIQKQEKADKSKAGETMSTYINVLNTHWVIFNSFWADVWWSFSYSRWRWPLSRLEAEICRGKCCIALAKQPVYWLWKSWGLLKLFLLQQDRSTFKPLSLPKPLNVE